ncbi:MAG: MlaE family lipid ABC transporter permease subunit [Alphaproteobacteria bacterium]|nr:MlaE family lipid ABC transporter permease subunit [Alphaproteobacteria bacterium]
MAEAARLDLKEFEDRLVVVPGGRWAVDTIARFLGELESVPVERYRRVTLDLDRVDFIDTAGALALQRAIQHWQDHGIVVAMRGGGKDQHAIFTAIERHQPLPMAAEPPRNSLLEMLDKLGRATLDVLHEVVDLIAFLGRIVVALAATLRRPRQLRATSLIFHMEEVGLNAMPIVGLMAFLLGVVLAFQGASQLQRFGAEVFVVNLVGISLLREIGVLMSAIIVAGRSGSAFTAQIGSMKVNQEVDALQAMGLDPIHVLVVPRLLALVLTLPLLAFFADIMGLIGGGLMAWIVLDISPATFAERLPEAVSMWSFWVGIIKAPFFAFLIAMIGSYEGFQVEGSATSLGQRTTRAVVEAIFLVIAVDAAFSVFFQVVGI